MNRENIIYGAGDFGKRLYNFLKTMNVKVDYFCQTKVETDRKVLFNIPVLSLEELGEESNSKNVFIAVKNANVSVLIKRQLTTVLASDDHVYQCGDFIRENLLLNNNDGEKINSTSKFRCNICGKEVDAFLDGGHEHGIFKEHHIIGGGRRKNCVCPLCGSYDRERWCMDVITNYTHILDAECRILHFAPERGLYELIRSNELADYYCGDIIKTIVNNKVDVTDMCQFGDSAFDYIIINHVLEHVIDYKKALHELKRVLKQDGKIIMSFPICTDMETTEQEKDMNDDERILHFGQKDHVRLFGYDYKEKIECQGFKVSVLTPKEKYTPEQIEYYGFIEDDIILICEKE